MTEAALTVAVLAPLSVTLRVEPDGLENCRLLVPSAAFSCETIEAMPPEKLIPISCSDCAPGAFCSGSAVGSSR